MSGIQVTNFGNTLGLPAGYVEAITAIVTDEIKFCVQNTTTNGTGGQVPVFQNPQLVRATNVVIDNSDNLSVGGTVTVGNNVPANSYVLPDAIGAPQQVLQVPAVGNELEWVNNASGNPFNQDLNTFNDVSFNSVTTANITGPTKVSVAGVDRLDITATETNLFSQNFGTGPTGTSLRLRNDNTFVLGTRFSDNGTIECNPNSMAIYGSEVKSAEILTNSSITKQLFNGTARIDREIMTGTGQEFRDGNGFNRLNITNSDGVTINSAFSLPTTTGSVGDVLTRTGTSATTWTAPAASPTYLPTLTVTALSQGPSALVQNYTFPRYAPTTDSLLATNPVAGYSITIPTLSSIRFRVERTTPFQAQVFFVPINPGIYIPTDLAEELMTRIRAVLTAFNVVADIFIDFDETIQKFSIVVIGNVVNMNLFAWSEYIPGTNNNDLFGLTTLSILLTAASTTPQFAEDIPPTLNSSTDLIWRNFTKNQIGSDNGASVVECSELNGIISYGDYNLNTGSLNNIGNINALDNCNITTNTTQIVNGLGELNININSLPRITQDAIQTKIECGTSALNLAALSDGLTPNTTTYLSAANIGNTANISAVVLPDSYNVYQNNGAIQRLIVDDTKSALFSKNGISGPAGSLLELNNDNTFTLGCFAANNGIIECRPNSMAMYGNSSNSSFIMTGSNITTALSNGSGRIDREILNTTSQSFRDPTGTERLKIDSDITVNNAYTLPTTAGVDGEVLTRTTGIATIWNRPQIYSIFSQITDQTVVNTAAETTIIGGGTPSSTLTVPPNFFTPGMTFRYTTGGLFRTSANNISARFRLRNSGVLFDSGLLVFSNRVIPATPWNVEATFAYMGGTVMVTNFNFQYNAGNDARGFTSQQSNNTFNATISNTLNFTIQWSVSSADNLITTNFGVVQKIY